MTVLPHVIVGALVGSYTNNVPLAIVGGVVSHFVLDSIPHYDHPIGTNHLKSIAAGFWWGSNILALGVLWFFYSAGLTIFVGALSAGLVDLENLLHMASGHGVSIHRSGRWHRKTSPIRGFILEGAVVLIGSVWLYLRLTTPMVV